MAYSGCLGPFQNEPHCKTFSTTTPKDDTTTSEENNTTPKEDNITTKGSSASIIQSALGFNFLMSILLWNLLE